MIEALRRHWRSAGFRLAFYCGFLVAITMLAALAVVYLQTVGVLQQRLARHVTLTAQQLLQQVEDGGLDAAGASIHRALTDGRDSDSEIYLLLDAQGQRHAGNLDRATELPSSASRPVKQRVSRDGKVVNAYLVVHALPGGGLLVVGQDLRDQEMIESLVASASAAAGIVAVLLLLAGTFVFRHELERSVGAIRVTAARIAAAGELRERVPESDEDDDDEFALLKREINAMLDRIESLMDGVRHVSNTIAHNLRTPLARILVRLHQAEQAQTDPAQRQRAIAAAVGEIQALIQVFEKLLQIAEAEAGARRRSFTPLALDVIATDVLELYEAAAEAQGTVLLREPADAVPLAGDRDLLAGALANLLDNALKYAGPGAVVRVGTEETPDGVRLSVQDDGPGVRPQELARLGMRFHRLQPDTPGHGLGLASVQAVAALHGGRLSVEDASPGLRVAIVLPRTER